jgi:hypothetical protein
MTDDGARAGDATRAVELAERMRLAGVSELSLRMLPPLALVLGVAGLPAFGLAALSAFGLSIAAIAKMSDPSIPDHVAAA